MNLKFKLNGNIAYGLSIGLLFILLEFFFRENYEPIGLVLNPKEYLLVILLFFIVSFLTNQIEKMFLFFIVSMFVLEIAHFNYFGYFLFPTEFILLVAKSNEVFETLITVLRIFVRPIIYILFLFVCLIVINKLTKNRLRYKMANYLFILVLLVSVLNTGLHYDQRAIGDRPDSARSIVKTSLYTVQAFLGKTLPIYVMDLSVLPKYKPEYKLVKNEEHEVPNVIFILGESLSLHYMSVFGYEKNTTPELSALAKNDRHMFTAKTLSAGVFTDTSIPMVLNIAKKPDAIEHILSNDTNLFRLASDNGYQTYWVSAHAKDEFSNLRSYMGLKYIHHYYDSSDFGFDEYTSAYDDVLLDEIKKIDFARKNFVVLSMIGSHSPYEARVRDGQRQFGDENMLQHYENTIAYTDYIVSSIIKYIKNNVEQEVLIVFTSDHGQNVNENQGGHGNIQDKKHYEVPSIVYAHNFDIDNKIRAVFNRDQWLTHYDVSLINAYYLGYDSLAHIGEPTAYIIGNELSGSSGYVEYDINNDKAVLK